MALGFGFNKTKVLAAAEKFVQQGKLQNAIAEYEKVVREDPKDLTVLNTIGDLYARVGQNEHAVHYFKKVADQYAQDGFTVKAIAIYKKLSKLAPNNAEHITRLAELYTQQGLYSDARAQYMLIADAHLRAGEHNQAARVFQRILELDPENTATQAKLAELYMKTGKKDEAVKIYSSAAEALYARRSYEAATEALAKVVTLDPHNAGALLLRGMIAADSGDSLSAIKYLEQVSDLDSRADALRALLRARLDSNQVEGAEQVAQTLLARHNDPSGINSLAEWNIKHGHASSAVKLYEHNADKLFSGGATPMQETLHPLIDKVKDNPEALNSLQRLLHHTGESSENAEMLELQAHACAQKGDYAQARDLYKRLSEIEPENTLHGENYRQMLAKLGEDSASRILTPEEAAQAFMMEELDQGAVVVHQKYDPPTESAIEAALTDAELFVSYNVPSKAIPPLEAALPLAPKDITLNQRLATLYARAGRYGDAARLCHNLSEIYRELGHPNDAARYHEAARKYELRAGGRPAATHHPEPVSASPQPSPEIAASPTINPAANAAPAMDAGPSVQEFSFDAPDQLAVEPEPVPAPAEIVPPALAAQEFPVQASAPELPTEPALAAAAPEIDVSNEWEEMLSVEVEGSETAAAPAPEKTQKAEPRLPAQAPPETAPVHAGSQEREGGSDVCYLVDDKVQEIQFYISQKMWQPAKNALNALSEIAPDSPHIPELIAAISAAQSAPVASPHASEPAAVTTLEQMAAAPPARPAATPVPPAKSPAVKQPFAPEAPAVETTLPAPLGRPFTTPVPPAIPPVVRRPSTAASSAPARQAAGEDFVLELGEEITPPTARSLQPPASPRKEAAVSGKATEDILSDFVHELERTDLKDFVPRPEVQPAVVVATGSPAARASAGTSSARASQTNGSAQADDASSVLSEILSDLRQEAAGTEEPEEDPETHYNLGIAFKEMGLLDEAIGELQKVCRAIDRGHGFSQPVQAYTWLAQCLVDKGAPEAAIRWYQKVLQIPGLDDSSRCAIYYDLAAAYEAFGDKKSALANFMEVYGSNIDFRDVASRIKTLKS